MEMDAEGFTLESGSMRFVLKIEPLFGTGALKLTYVCSNAADLSGSNNFWENYFNELLTYPVCSKVVRSWWWERIFGYHLDKKCMRAARLMKEKLINTLRREGREVVTPDLLDWKKTPLLTLPESDTIH